MDAVLHELVCPPEELCGNKDDRRGSVTDFLVLLLGKVDEDLSGGVFNVEQGEDGGAVVGHRHISNVVDHHFIQTAGAKRTADYICNCLCRQYVLVTNVCAADF